MYHIEIVTMRVWKELVRADGEGVTRELPEFQRGLHRGQCAEDERGGSAQMLALVSQRDCRCFPIGIISSTRCCQCLCTCTVCACRGWKREPEPLGFQMVGRHQVGGGVLSKSRKAPSLQPKLVGPPHFCGDS